MYIQAAELNKRQRKKKGAGASNGVFSSSDQSEELVRKFISAFCLARSRKRVLTKYYSTSSFAIVHYLFLVELISCPGPPVYAEATGTTENKK